MKARIVRHVLPAAAAAVLALTPLAARAGGGKPRHQAKVERATARATALAKVKGKVVSSELEHEDGRWIYSFEIKPDGETRKIVKEVNVDADSGAIVSVETERER